MNDDMYKLGDKHRDEILEEFPESAAKMFAASQLIVTVVAELTKEQARMLLRQQTEANELA